jgi:DNA-directed RNA polymerase subunit alpha
MMWRGLELPGRVLLDKEMSDDSYGRFTIEPFEQGFGTTIGNSLRRVLLSSLEGAAVTAVKIEGVSHEFASIDGVVEDVTDILLNIKGIVVRYGGDEPTTMSLKRDKAGEVRAGNIECGPSLEVVNPDHLLATLTADVPFHMEFRVARGRGYATAADNRSPEQELGVIPIDSIYAPVLRVRYTTEAMRVGQHTNYDRLILEVWTDGSVQPEDALAEAALILRKHLNPFVMYHELGEETVARARPEPVAVSSGVDLAQEELLNKPIAALNLSVRASNCLDAAKIMTLRDLVVLTEADLLRFRSFGKTSLHEVHHKLAEMGLSLAMKLDDEEEPGVDLSPSSDAGLGTLVSGPGPVPASVLPDELTPAPPPAPPSASEDEPSEQPDKTSTLGNSGHTPVSTVGE